MSLVARLSLVATVLAGAVLVLLPGLSVAADTIQVAVVDEAPEYRDGNADGNDSPSHTVVTAGDAVVWRWADSNESQHTVTSRADSDVQFDSDGDCEGEEDTSCREGGNVFVVRFEEPGTYPYYCKLHSDPGGLTGATGTIEVQAAPEPSESETTSEQPSDDGSSEPSGSGSSSPPSDGGSSGPDDGGSQEPEPEPQDDPSSPQPQETSSGDAGSNDDRPPSRRAVGPGFGVRQQPESTEPGVSPEVAPEAVSEPTFSPFPTAPELPTESETDIAVNVPAPEGGGPARGVLIGVAVASVIGSAGAFGKVVLFGRPWG